MDITEFKIFAHKNNIEMYISDAPTFPDPDDDKEKNIKDAVEFLIENDPTCTFKTKEEYLTFIKGSKDFIKKYVDKEGWQSRRTC